MFRTLTLMVMGFVFVPTAHGQNLELGEEFKGTLTGKAGFARSYFRSGPPWHGFGKELTITLKEGHSLKVVLKVTGDDRKAGVALFDATQKMIKYSEFAAKPAEFTVMSLPDSGEYKLLVFSDGVGGFTLLANSSSKERSAKRIEEEIKELERKLAALKEELKAAQARENKP